MGRPQPGLFLEETAQHLHVEWLLPADVAVADVVAAVTAARRASQSLRGPNQVWGFAPSLWRRLSPEGLPADVHDFEGMTGPGGTAPGTQRSVWLWAAGNVWEKVWAACSAADAHLVALSVARYELRCYTPVDDRDPTGFIDGTENPELDEAVQVALYPDGGSAVLVQQWVHDLAAFNALPQSAQEGVFGRTKQDSEELPEGVMPETSHVSRNVIENADGEELHIFRRNTPFASLEQAGTMYIGCTNDPARTDLMLARMFGVSGDGLIDDLTRFSTAVSGSYYFVPDMDALTAVFGPLDAGDEQSQPQPPAKSELGIGSLRHLAE
jgi:putative iron-dependent peroxidase